MKPRPAQTHSEGEIVSVPLTHGYSTIVDSVDADLANFNWSVQRNTASLAYARRSLSGGKQIAMHRVIAERALGYPIEKGDVVDHINGNGLDNRRSNLRVCSQSDNLHNQSLRKSNKSGTKGVCWDKATNRWHASIRLNYRLIQLGRFAVLEDAIAARHAAELQYYGAFSTLVCRSQEASEVAVETQPVNEPEPQLPPNRFYLKQVVDVIARPSSITHSLASSQCAGGDPEPSTASLMSPAADDHRQRVARHTNKPTAEPRPFAEMGSK